MNEPTPTIDELFPDSLPIDRSATSLESRCDWPKIPGKMAVYLLSTTAENSSDSSESPVLLATVGDLRSALKRRLADDSPDLRTKRIHYAKLCDRIRFRIVHSPFAANLAYLDAARTLFPAAYKKLIAHRPTWWIAVNPNAPFPKFDRTQFPDDPAALYAGPIREKSAAGKLIETAEDLFDLCRYHHILVQAPHGKACAYKEMGKCPAPCDGSVPMDWYHAATKAAFGYITGQSRAQWLDAQHAAMRTAAQKLEFEKAGKIKQRLQRAAILDGPAAEPFRYLAPLADFSFLSLQPGKGKQWAEPFLIHGGNVIPCEPLSSKLLPAAAEKLLTRCRETAGLPVQPPLTNSAIERLAVIAHHLFKGEDDWGTFLPLHSLTTINQILQSLEEMNRRSGRAKPLLEQSSEPKPKKETPQKETPEPSPTPETIAPSEQPPPPKNP